MMLIPLTFMMNHTMNVRKDSIILRIPRVLKNYSWTLNKFNSNLSSFRTTNYSTIFIPQL